MSDVVETLLQLINVVDERFIHPLLHDAPDLVVDGIQVWMIALSDGDSDDVSYTLNVYLLSDQQG